MRLLLTGAGGQFGTAFHALAAGRGHDVVGLVHKDPAPARGAVVDLADLAAARAAVLQAKPDWVVHGAAWTDVDGCERDPARAQRVNGDATGTLAQAARTVGARMACVSTDYVFDGTRGAYREEDATGPVNAYGASKLDGERQAQAALHDCVVARTSAVFAPRKRNFVTWLLGELRAGKPVRIVQDQRVNPTYAPDLAAQVLALVEQGAQGVFHTAGATPLSRLEAARAVAKEAGLDAELITPVKSADLGWFAKRPMDTTLDVRKVQAYCQPMAFDAAVRRLLEAV